MFALIYDTSSKHEKKRKKKLNLQSGCLLIHDFKIEVNWPQTEIK